MCLASNRGLVHACQIAPPVSPHPKTKPLPPQSDTLPRPIAGNEGISMPWMRIVECCVYEAEAEPEVKGEGAERDDDRVHMITHWQP